MRERNARKAFFVILWYYFCMSKLVDEIIQLVVQKSQNNKKQIVLFETSLVEELPEKLQTNLVKWYSDQLYIINILASVINAIYTQQNPVFILSYRSINKLIKNDQNININALNGSQWKFFKKNFIFDEETQIFSVVREQKNKIPGLYEIKQEELLSMIESSIGREILEKRKKVNIKWYDDNILEADFKEQEKFKIIEKIVNS